MKTNMNQRKLSMLWSSLFAVMMMLVGVNSAAAQGVQAYSPTNVLVYSNATCNASTLQAAFNAAGTSGPGGEVLLLANCNLEDDGTVTVSQSTFLTAGGGSATLTVGEIGGSPFESGAIVVTNGATLSIGRPNVNDNIDVIVGSNGTGSLTVNSGATLALNGLGNALRIDTNGTITNNGTITTTGSPRTTGTGNILGTLTGASDLAPAGVYREGTSALAGTGTWGNIFFMSNITIGAATTFKMAASSEVVINADVAISANLSFTNATAGAFDVQHRAGTLSGSSAFTNNGNHYVTGGSSTHNGALTIDGDLDMSTTNYSALGTTVVKGNITIADNTFSSSVTPGVTTWGNVSISDAQFNPSLTMTQSSGTSTSSLSSTAFLTSLTVASGKTVNNATALSITTLNVAGTFNKTASTLSTSTTTNSGSMTISSGASYNPTTSHTNTAGTTTNNGTYIGFTTAVSGGTFSNTSSFSTTNVDLTGSGTLTNSGSLSVSGVLSNSGSTNFTTTAGTSSVNAFNANSNNGTVTVSGGILDVNSTTTNNGTFNRSGGTFNVYGNFTNNGAIGGLTLASGLGAAQAAAVTSAYVANIVNAAMADGINVYGNFTNNNAYSGNVIVHGVSLLSQWISGSATFGNITTRSNVWQVRIANDIDVSGHLIVAEGNFAMTGNEAYVYGTSTGSNGVPGSGIYVGANAKWDGGTVIATGDRVAFGQVTAALVNGPLVVNGGQVQLTSNTWTASAVINAGATVKRELNTYCFDFNVAGSTTGVVLQCGVFTITEPYPSIRAQLKAAGYDPDNVNTSVQIAIGNGNMIALTDQDAETSPSAPAPTFATWKGVTIVDSQKSFILSSGTVVLNDANLTLRGAFVYDGNWNDADSDMRTRMIAGSAGSMFATKPSLAYYTFAVDEIFENNNGGYLVFDGLQQPNANFIYTGDGVNSTVDGFVLRRVRFNRTGASPIAIVDNGGTVASSIVVSEKLQINGQVNPGDNNIKWVGGNDRSYSGSIPAQRQLSVNVAELVGTGYFWLANDDQGSDANTVTVAGATGKTNLKMQFRKSGDAGTSAGSKDVLSNITAFGNGGMSYVEAGWLQSGADFASVNSDMTMGANRAVYSVGSGVFELQNSVTFTGNLFMTDRNTTVAGSPIYSTNATLLLATGSADRETVVNGTFQAANFIGTSNVVAGSGSSTNAHNLKLNARVIFGAENEAGQAPTFNIARPSRVIFASGTSRNLEYINGVTAVRIQRVQFNTAAAATYTLVAGTTLRVNDLLMSNGLLNTNGGLAMVDLVAADANHSASLAMENFSIVTRAARTAEISRGSSSTGAYTAFNYSSSANGGAPYTLQYTGAADRFTGDEVPGLPLINGNNSNVNRLVMDATGATVEFGKDLVVNNRFEMLNGTLEMITGSNMDLAGNALWVQGNGALTANAQSKFRFPNNSANSVYNSGTTTYDLFYVSNANFTTGFEYTGAVRHLTMRTSGTKAAPVTLTMSGNKAATGSVRVIDGVLNLNNTTLTIGGNLVVDGLHNANNLSALAANNLTNARVAAWFPARKGSEVASLNPYNYGVGTTTATGYVGDGYGRIVDTNGTLTFTGTGSAAPVYAVGYVQVGNELFSLPNVVLNTSRNLYFDLNQGFTQGFDQSAINEYRVLSFTQNANNAYLRPGLVTGLAGLSSDAPNSGAEAAEAGFTTAKVTQRWNVVNDFTLNGGNFWSYGATMTVGGNYTQGQAVTPKVASIFYGGQSNGRTEAGSGQTALNFQVVGNFTVLEDKAADAVPNATTDNANAHRFYLSMGTLKVGGNYSFFGHADVTDGINMPYSRRGFRGTIEFNGTANQTVNHVQVTGAQPAAYKAAGQYGRGFFHNVTINGAGITIGGGATTHMYVNDLGTLNLKKGIVTTGAKELVLFNDEIDEWAVNTLVGGAIVNGGSNSFVQGNVRRFVTYGFTTGGANWYGSYGYAFPLGHREGNRDFYRPMTLAFPANLGETISVVAGTSVNDGAIINPALNVAGLNGTLRLNKTSGATWNVTLEKRPALEPNIRLGAQGVITNPVANVDDMRIVARGSASDAWRLFGVYDLNGGTNPDDSFNPNDWLDGIPTFWQEGVDFFAQSVNGPYTAEVRLATTEPFNPFTGSGTVAFLQVIHNSPAGAVDVLVNDALFLDNFAYQTATSFTPVVADTPLNIALKTANGATELLTINGAVLEANKSYILIAQGGADGKAFEVKVVDYARSTSTISEAMQFFFSHGVTNGPAVNVERVTTTTPRTLEQLVAVNATYGSTGNYLTQLNPGITTLQLKAGGSVVGQYLFDFGAYAGKSMTLLATGRVGGTGANRLIIIGVDAAGNVVVPQVTTSNEVEAELPAVFTVHGNYPNPFNPTTNVRFDLPEQANVRIEVVDVLGRQVMTVAPQTMSAGAGKVITIDAARLSSGTYFYRVVAEGATRTFIQGSKFTLVK